MKTKLYLVASALLLATPVFAQEPLEKAGTEPSTMQATPPSSTATEPLEKMGTEPSTNMAPAAGQQAATPGAKDVVVIGELTETEDDGKMVGPLNATVDKVEEMDVLDANGKKIAEVDAVLQDKDGNIKGVAIEYGGFLGIGEKGAVMTLDQVKEKNGNLVTEVTEEQLPSLPSWHH